jgi:hypothetical protein
LIPVDHDPFGEGADPLLAPGAAPNPPDPGWGSMLSQALGLDTLADVSRGYVRGQAELAGRDWSQEPLIGVGQGGELTGRIPAFAGQFTSGLAGPVPAGALGAGPAILRRAGALETPFEDAAAQGEFVGRLRDAHLARDDALPLVGKQAVIEPPPHIQTDADMTGLVNRYADLAQQGAPWRDWYTRSGQAILAAAGGDPSAADKVAAAAARTSTGTDVDSNMLAAITMHNQAMAGDPLRAGRFPNQMGPAVERYYYGGEPISGEKIKPFMGAVAEEWNPDFAHTFVNDVWNMRSLEYPPKGDYQATEGGLYAGSPTNGQHNFSRIVADQAGDELARRTGVDWSPKQTMAATWVAQKAKTEGIPLQQAAGDFADGLRNNYAQLSWESAPGMTTNHLPEFHTAAPEDRQAFHDAIRGALTDDQGRDLIAQHLGLLTGPSFDAPGVYAGRVNPGTQGQVALGQAPGGWRAGVDPASRDLADTGELVRGLLLRQDAVGWHKPAYAAGMGLKDANMADIRLADGRPLSLDEAGRVTQGMADRTGSDFFSPIGTPQGYRLLNVPEASGLNNQQFQRHVRDLVADDLHPDADIVHARADSNYIANDWKANPNGQDFVRALGGTGRPDLQRAGAQLLATLGPRVSQIEEDFHDRLGWTPDRASRIWETSPVIQRYQGSVVPSPPKPWLQRPAPQGSRPPLLVPVDHDPFNPLAGGA